MSNRRASHYPVLLIVWVLIAGSFSPAFAQSGVTSPKEHFGFQIGDDYQLATYRQMVEFWKKLDQQSERLSLVDIGKTAEGRTLWMAIVTAPENQRKLARYKEIARRLALAENLTDEQARELAQEGRAVVWIDGGLHATEVLGAQQLIEMVYQMASREDAETQRFLKEVILLAAIANPDGMDLVSDWYMREAEPAKRSTGGLPRLYHKYIGHDNNRDFYLSSQPETESINRIFYLEWFPQIVYNHHQTGPPGTVLFAPPFRDPFNYYFDPLVPTGIDLVSAAMHRRFITENKPGATMRSGASYSTWWNGGLRTTVYFHNMIGLLTEAIGNPTPVTIPFVPQRQLPMGDYPYPIAPQKTWHFRQSIEYSITANRAVLDIAAKHREDFLFNIYRMGKNSIERGTRDHWTVMPRQLEAVQQAIAKDRPPAAEGPTGRGGGGGGRFGGSPIQYYEMLRDPKKRDPRGFILPSDQADFLTATKFINALMKTGVTVHRATAAFTVADKSYPAGSYVVKTNQAFRPHVLDMFQPQDHPNDIPYPGGPPRPPYDSAGYTLAMQMGVQYDRLLEGFDGPFEKISGLIRPAAGRMVEVQNAQGYLLSHRVNDAFLATNRLLASGEQVYWLKQPFQRNGNNYEAGTLYIPSKAGTVAKLRKLAAEVGLNFEGTPVVPAVEAFALRLPRIGLWDRYGGSMPSGWTRWLLEQFDCPFEVVYLPTLDAGGLAGKYDVLIFVDGSIPGREGRAFEGTPIGEAGETMQFPGQQPTNVPAEYQNRLGNISIGKTIPQLKQFLEEGGTMIAIGSATSMVSHLGLPVSNALVEKLADGTEQPLRREKFYVPGSLLQARVNNMHPLAYGMPERADFFFDNSPVWRLLPEAPLQGIQPVAWFDSPRPLRSGWAWGEGYLNQGVVVLEAPVGKGKLLLFGPQINFRAQPHGTFKLLFNGIYYARAETTSLK